MRSHETGPTGHEDPSIPQHYPLHVPKQKLDVSAQALKRDLSLIISLLPVAGRLAFLAIGLGTRHPAAFVPAAGPMPDRPELARLLARIRCWLRLSIHRNAALANPGRTVRH